MPKIQPEKPAFEAPEEAASTPKPETSKAPVRRTVEELRDEQDTPAWLFAGAKMKHSWPVGAELSDAEYEAALRAAADEPIGYVAPAKTDEVTE